MNENIPDLPLFPWWKKTNSHIALGFFLIVFSVIWYAIDLGIAFPPSFEGIKVVTIRQGESAHEVATAFLREGLIRQRFDFLLYLKLAGKDKKIKPGNYSFRESISVLDIVEHITSGAAERTIRIQEGWTNFAIAVYLEREGVVLKEDFIKAASGTEGYLFPDTYRIFQNTSAETLIDLFEKTFNQKIEPLRADIERQNRSLHEIVIMASLIEKESSGEEDRAIISGILWKRLGTKIPLQVDATLSYLTGKASNELTEADLAIDSKYNTYKYAGLPHGPIGNPGLSSMRAALYPQSSPYLFYLHGSDGKAYYAQTFDEHVANKIKYLK
ncbi:MAG TPA: endolytic transglycosylase MltG [Candidatus Paceibacterota bacterium]